MTTANATVPTMHEGHPAADNGFPDDRRKRLAERVLREKAKGTKNFLQVVADEEGISKGRLHQILTRAKPRDAFGAMADTLIRPASKGKAKP